MARSPGRILARLEEARQQVDDRLERLAGAVPMRPQPRLPFGEYWQRAMELARHDPEFAASLEAAARQLRREKQWPTR